MTMKPVLGIDPGKSGGLALAFPNGKIKAWKMPETERDIWDLFQELRKHADHAVIELVRSQPGMGLKSIFTFGRGLGGLRMALIASGFVFEEVTPLKWQGAMKCRTGGDKNVSKARAQELFPREKVTHALADAMLIAVWGLRFSKLAARGRPRPVLEEE